MKLPSNKTKGDKLFLNDGLISLKVEQIQDNEVHCQVRAGGELLSRKGLNLPGIDLGFSAFTEAVFLRRAPGPGAGGVSGLGPLLLQVAA